MSYAARMRQAYPFKAASTSVDHLVIGGGVLGLSAAAGLVNTAGRGRTTFLVEKRNQLWQNTSQRKTDVIQSGIYYPIGSLKSQLSIRGRDLLYDRCEALGIEHRKTQKLVVATSNSQIPYLDYLQGISVNERLRQGTGVQSSSQNDSSIPAYFLSGDDARDMEPDLSPAVNGAVIMTETGILDRRGLIQSLEKEVEEEEYLETPVGVGLGVGRRIRGKGDGRGHGVIVRGTRVVRIDADEKGGWVVQLESGWNGEEGVKGEIEAVRAQVVVNAAGVGGAELTEGVRSECGRVPEEVVRGGYLLYTGPGVENVSRIIHPCPTRHSDGVSARLSIDLDGIIHFGPDLSFLSPASQDPSDWPQPSESDLQAIGQAIQDYLPNIDPSLLQPGYSELRPAITHDGGIGDFMIRHTEDRTGLIELLGFDSPLTPALAVGELVADKVKKEVWRGGRQVDELAKGWE